ncbi:DNA primase [Candidatus Woesearchaeota archaeon]|nr:DNA primase [Candidatus Woesearchaeota archaeon]
MGKISPVSAKYIVNAQIQIEGVVDRPDVIGAIFGQTEGLLGADLELRELQRSGRIGRIEVKSDIKGGKTSGLIIIPSSLDKTETAIIAASLETIQRIGPCNSKVNIEKIEDVRVSKRNFVIERAKSLLKDLTEQVLPDSQEITDEVAASVRMMEVTEYGKDRLPAGPAIEEGDDIIVVEGRADVLNLLKHGIKNAIAMNGTNVPETIAELSKRKVITLFVDGDRGGDLIIKEVGEVAEIDYVVKAPDGKEVEEITKKEIHKALRSKVAFEQVRMDLNGRGLREIREQSNRREEEFKTQAEATPQNEVESRNREFRKPFRAVPPQTVIKKQGISPKNKEVFKGMLDNLIGTRGAYILDQNLNILGKVPTTELNATIKNLNSVYAVVFDGVINRETSEVAQRSNVKYLVAMESRAKSEGEMEILTGEDL